MKKSASIMVVVLFAAALTASAQGLVMLDDNTYVTRQPDAGGSWSASEVVYRDPGAPDAAQSGSIFLHTTMPGPLDAGKIVVRTGVPAESRIAISQVNPVGAQLSFWYRSNRWLNMGVMLATGDWGGNKPATGDFSETGVLVGSATDNCVLGQVVALNAAATWTQVTLTFSKFEQTVDPALLITRLGFSSANWVGTLGDDGLANTFFDVDNVVFTNGTGHNWHPGDANKDDVVTDADYTLWADNYNKSSATWEMGDFNGDTLVTDADYTIWADHYGHTSQSPVPEPATLSLLGVLGLGLIRRRK